MNKRLTGLEIEALERVKDERIEAWSRIREFCPSQNMINAIAALEEVVYRWAALEESYWPGTPANPPMPPEPRNEAL